MVTMCVAHSDTLYEVDTDTHKVFLNIVLDEAVEEKADGEKVRIGMVVRGQILKIARVGKLIWRQVIRGNSVVMLEANHSIPSRMGPH